MEPRWLVYSGGFRSSLFRRFAQRSLDVLISVVGLALACLLMLITALLIRLDSPGPIFYRQERVGKGERPFKILKFRSMHVDAEADNVPRWAQVEHPVLPEWAFSCVARGWMNCAQPVMPGRTKCLTP